jgi:hypothetical protein
MLRSIPARAAVVVALVAAVVGLARAHLVVPEPRAVKGEQCVEPVDVMRRDHMDMLMHQRDETVLSGIRTRQHSLVGCINCHADSDEQGRPIPVNAKDQFCQTCHSYAAVQLDCFQCHAAVPEENPALGMATIRPTASANVE